MSKRRMSREALTLVVEEMLAKARRFKKRVSTEDAAPSPRYFWDQDYWWKYVRKLDEAIAHYCSGAKVFIYPSDYDGKYTVKQLEVLKFILSQRRNNVSKAV